MSMILIFNRKVIPLSTGEKGAAKVETDIVGFIDSTPYEIGQVKFPSKQSWTKFWGAINRGALNIPEFEVKLQNVLIDDGEVGDPQKEVNELINQPKKKWVGNQLVDVDANESKHEPVTTNNPEKTE